MYSTRLHNVAAGTALREEVVTASRRSILGCVRAFKAGFCFEVSLELDSNKPV